MANPEQKLSLIETIEDELTKQERDPVVLCGLIEQITGGSSTSDSFRGRMLEIRASKQTELVHELAKALDEEIDALRKDVSRRREEGLSVKNLESDIALYEESVNDAREAYWAVREVEEAASKLPVNPLVVAPRNNFTDAGDYFRAETRKRVEKSVRRA